MNEGRPSATAGGVLVVVAHPDDEVLGFGGTAAILSTLGIPVTACIASGRVSARGARPNEAELLEDTYHAAGILGMCEPIVGDFPNIRMNIVPHLELVRFVEDAILRTRASHVFTHHPGDLNDDHRQVSSATQAALRIWQRRSETQIVQSAHTMEVPSSTDWAFPGTYAPFAPNACMEIGNEGVTKKLQALQAYRGVMRSYPHPRSEEAIRGLAAFRGAAFGVAFAEAFQTLNVNLASILAGG